MRQSTSTAGRVARVGGAVLAAGAAAVLIAPARFAPDAGPGPADTARAGAPTSRSPSAPSAPSPAPTPASPSAGPAPTATPSAPDDDPTAGDLRLVELRGGWRDGEDLGTAVALAALVGAAHVDDGGRVAPQVAVEAVEQPGPDAAVVTLLVRPRGTGDGDAAASVRLAVPVRTGATGVRIGGTPWRLPGPRLDPDPPVGRPVTDPALLEAAGDALVRAGFDGAALTALEATDAWPFVAHLEGTARGTAPTTVWLRWHLDRFVVTGLPLHSAAGSGQGTEFP